MMPRGEGGLLLQPTSQGCCTPVAVWESARQCCTIGDKASPPDKETTCPTSLLLLPAATSAPVHGAPQREATASLFNLAMRAHMRKECPAGLSQAPAHGPFDSTLLSNKELSQQPLRATEVPCQGTQRRLMTKVHFGESQSNANGTGRMRKSWWCGRAGSDCLVGAYQAGDVAKFRTSPALSMELGRPRFNFCFGTSPCVNSPAFSLHPKLLSLTGRMTATYLTRLVVAQLNPGEYKRC